MILKSRFKLRWLFAGILASYLMLYFVFPATSQGVGYVRFRDVPTATLVQVAKQEMLDAISVKATGVAIDAFPYSDDSSQWRIASEAWARQSREIAEGDVLSLVAAHQKGLAVDPGIKIKSVNRLNAWNGPVVQLVIKATDGSCKSAHTETPLHRCLKKQVRWYYDHVNVRFTEVQGRWHVADIHPEDWYSEEIHFWETYHDPVWYSCYTYENGLGDCNINHSR